MGPWGENMPLRPEQVYTPQAEPEGDCYDCSCFVEPHFCLCDCEDCDCRYAERLGS